MPIVVLTTNIKDDDIPDEFEKKMSETVAEMLDRQLQDITTILNTGRRVYKDGHSSPYCLLQLNAFRGFDSDKNPTYTQKLIEFLKMFFDDIRGDRIQIQYRNEEPSMCGVGKRS